MKFWSQKRAYRKCDLPPKQVTLSMPWDAHLRTLESKHEASRSL